MSKAFTGQIFSEHIDGATNTEVPITAKEGNSGTAASLVHPAGALVRFKSKVAGEAYNTTAPTVSGGTFTEGTHINTFDTLDEWDGTDGKVYVPAAATGNNSALYRSIEADIAVNTGASLATAANWFSTAHAATTAAATIATQLSSNVDNLSSDDYNYGADDGDATVATNVAARVNRTLWL